MLCGKCRCCACCKIPGGTARGCWPVQELALLCPERQADLPALYAGNCYQACILAWFCVVGTWLRRCSALESWRRT